MTEILLLRKIEAFAGLSDAFSLGVLKVHSVH